MATHSTLTFDGCGGSYLLSITDDDHYIGVFKPRDEEFMATNNPRGYVLPHAILGKTIHPVQPGFRIGNGALKERAAYVLDSTYGNYSGVPPTCLFRYKKKYGSLQEFVKSKYTAEDFGPSKFPIDQVQKIAILDIRLFNADRHVGNILISKTYEMTPIDHGFCLPSFDGLQSAMFDWLSWSQTKAPLNKTAREYLLNMDIKRDADILRSTGVDENCITTFRLTSFLLWYGVIRKGKTLYDVGCLLIRQDNSMTEPSEFEKLVAKCTLVKRNPNLSKREFGDVIDRYFRHNIAALIKS